MIKNEWCMINSYILKHSISLAVNIVIYHWFVFFPKYLNVYSHDLGGSTSLAVVITSFNYSFLKLLCYLMYNLWYNAVLSFFKEISLKKTITVGGGVNINDIYYTIFSNVLCFQLCSHPLPLRGQHYANQFWEPWYNVKQHLSKF